MYCTSNHDDDWWKERYILWNYERQCYNRKMISEKDESIEKNVKLPSDADVSVKKGDFVIVYKLADSDKIVKVKKVDHDDVPHGLMMKIHDMGKMHMKH